jgi:hypothetical protein
MKLLDFSNNVHSQNGEDGILAKILELLPERDRWCVEFGAWDGVHLSNTCNLIKQHNYSAVLIEPDVKKFADLTGSYGSNPKVIPVNSFVGFAAADGLDTLLMDKPIPKDFDVLSIDIDGNDYHVWNVVTSYSPKIVCIEYNNTIPNEVEFIQPMNPELSQGSSLLSLTRLARGKGYELVCVTNSNAIFLRSKYFPLLGIPDNQLSALRQDFSAITYIFCGYDGTLLVSGRGLLAHHRGIRIAKRLRQIPRMFRAYPDNLGKCRSLLYTFYWRAARFVGRG